MFAVVDISFRVTMLHRCISSLVSSKLTSNLHLRQEPFSRMGLVSDGSRPIVLGFFSFTCRL